MKTTIIKKGILLLLIPVTSCLFTACFFDNPLDYEPVFYIYSFKDSADYSEYARLYDYYAYKRWLLNGADSSFYHYELDKPISLDSGYYIVLQSFNKNNVYLNCSIDEWNARQVTPNDSLFLIEKPYKKAYMCTRSTYEEGVVCEHIQFNSPINIRLCDTGWFNNIIKDNKLENYFIRIF